MIPTFGTFFKYVFAVEMVSATRCHLVKTCTV